MIPVFVYPANQITGHAYVYGIIRDTCKNIYIGNLPKRTDPSTPLRSAQDDKLRESVGAAGVAPPHRVENFKSSHHRSNDAEQRTGQ